MLTVSHIHRPSLDRYTIRTFGTVRDVQYKRVGSKYQIILDGDKVKTLDSKKDLDVFVHPVLFDRYNTPWFYGVGSGTKSRNYAHEQGHLCLIAKETSRCRNFIYFHTRHDYAF